MRSQTHRIVPKDFAQVRRRCGTLVLLAALLALVGCVWVDARYSNRNSDAAYAELRARTATEFALGTLYKPRGTNRDDLLTRFAPLIVQEARTNALPASAPEDQIGSCDPRLETGCNHAGSAVYGRSKLIEIDGRPHWQLTYFWCYSRTPPDGERIQGTRVTLDSGGSPVIWEVLSNDLAMDALFVAESLESAAAAQFGGPLPGHRYAIEKQLGGQAGAGVVRVIEDGPLPMGPMVYVAARTRAVTTINCRCMPSQVRQLTGTVEYELRQIDQIWEKLDPNLRASVERVRGGERKEVLEESVRLPSRF